MTERVASPSRTYAFLAGVEKYKAAWNLNGPVRDVLDCHSWLRFHGVPAEQITVVASPLDENRALLDAAKLAYIPATSIQVKDALNELHAKNGELLFLFWAGHGMVHEKQRRLFLADATDDDKRNLDFDALRDSLASIYFQGFLRQIIIADVCANYGRFAFTLPGEKLPVGDAGRPEQFVFFAARSGEVAKNLGEEKRGLFSRELLKQLREQADTNWPPDMLKVAQRVQVEFAALRAHGCTHQTPIYEWSRGWDGSSIELVAPPTQTKSGRAVYRGGKLKFPQITGLTDALLGCENMQVSDGRDEILAQMRKDISLAVPRHNDAKSDVVAIIRTAANFSGGLEELLAVVQFFEGPTDSWDIVEKVVAERFPNLHVQAMQYQGAGS